METQELLKLMIEKLDSMGKSQEAFHKEMISFQKETKENFGQLNEKLDLLTKQTQLKYLCL